MIVANHQLGDYDAFLFDWIRLPYRSEVGLGRKGKRLCESLPVISHVIMIPPYSIRDFLTGKERSKAWLGTTAWPTTNHQTCVCDDYILDVDLLTGWKRRLGWGDSCATCY